MTNSQNFSIEQIAIILGINLVISVVYILINKLRKDFKGGIIIGAFMIICPIVGPLYLFLSWLVFNIYFRRRGKGISVEELSLKKGKIDLLTKPDMKNALDKVPLEEALLVSDKKSTRKLLLDILREDGTGSLSTIFKAVEHEDSEVSHYAASAISDMINDFKIKEKKLRENIKENNTDTKLFMEYLDYVYSFLCQSILQIAEQRYYSFVFEDSVLTMEEFLPNEISGDLYNKLVFILLHIGEVDKAKAWVEKALSSREGDLDSFKAGLRYYYYIKDREKFLYLLEKLKRSEVLLDSDILGMVRFFNY